MDNRESTKKALARFYERQDKKTSGPTRKNGKPEKEVEAAVLPWLRDKGFQVNVVESKAIYNPHAGRYLKGQTDKGFPDIIGSCPNGLVCAIELKAPGRRSTLRDKQREYLVNTISRGGFGVCVDSLELLEATYKKWRSFLSSDDQKEFLSLCLPVEKIDASSNDEDLFPW